MKKVMFSLIVLIMVLGCATAPETEAVVDYSGEPVMIQVKTPGISPAENGFFDKVDFLVSAGKNYTPEKWSLDILNESGTSINKSSGTGQVPSKLSWNGTGKNGEQAADGKYKARISIWFPGAVEPITQESAFFILDSIGPVGEISFSDGLFSPDDDGINDFLEINISVSDDLSEVTSWTLSVYDSHGAEIGLFHSDQHPDGTITWDGMKNGKLMVSSASNYEVVLSSIDSLGNSARVVSGFSTDILVFKEDNQLRIRVNSIIFKAFTADFMDVEAEERQNNMETLDLLASKLKNFPSYKIKLEGHAVSVFWDNPVKAAKENKEVLIPLSEARAEAIRDALKERGVNADSMSIVGLGANRPIVPFSDLQNRWKNRRVVFILTK